MQLGDAWRSQKLSFGIRSASKLIPRCDDSALAWVVLSLLSSFLAVVYIHSVEVQTSLFFRRRSDDDVLTVFAVAKGVRGVNDDEDMCKDECAHSLAVYSLYGKRDMFDEHSSTISVIR